MSQPDGEFTPPGNLPLYEGLDPEWNDIVGALPEDKRAELAPKLKERLDAYTPLKQYEDFHKSGVTNDQIQQALQLSTVIDNHPRQVYEKLAEFLGISREEAKEVVEEVEEGVEEGDDPRYAALKKQIDVLSQIMLNENQQKTQAQLNAQADAAIDKEINTVKKKFGDVDEEQLLLYMGRGLNAEQAYQAYTKRDADIRARRPAPTLLGSGQAVPRQAPDMAKMSPEDTRKFVAQMMEHGRQESRG